MSLHFPSAFSLSIYSMALLYSYPSSFLHVLTSPLLYFLPLTILHFLFFPLLCSIPSTFFQSSRSLSSLLYSSRPSISSPFLSSTLHIPLFPSILLLYPSRPSISSPFLSSIPYLSRSSSPLHPSPLSSALHVLPFPFLPSPLPFTILHFPFIQSFNSYPQHPFTSLHLP